MPLFEHTYRRHDGPRLPRWRRSLALARLEAGLLLRRRSFLLLLALSWVPAIVRSVQIYVAHQFPGAPGAFAVTDRLWQDFLGQQVLFLPVLLVSLYAGAGAVASDAASGALVLYLSKPISSLDYVVGKSLPLMGAIAFVTLVPALSLFALHLSLSGELEEATGALRLPFSVTGYSLWICLYFGLTVLAVSSLSRSGRMAGAGFAALALGSEAFVRGGLARLVEAEPPAFLSLTGATVDVGYLFFARRLEGSSPGTSLVVMGCTMIAAALLLRRRLRSPEDA